MAENENGILFHAKKANAFSTLNSMSKQKLVSYKIHFDLWRELIGAQNDEDLDRVIAKISEIYNREGGQLNDSVAD
ncbi:hypothetical protein ES703_48184 [subsurface metagenome]